MAILDSTKLDLLFKSFFSKARTSSTKQHFEENIPTAFDVHAKEVYLETIPSIPPSEDTAVVKKYTKLILTRDKSVANNLAWVALPEDQWSNNWSSGSANNIDSIVKNFVSPKYGSGYVVKVFKGDGTRIPELDATDWLFDYKSGVLTFQGNPNQDGSTKEKSIYLEVYQYIGRTAADAIGESKTNLSDLNDVDPSMVTGQDKILIFDQTSKKWTAKKVEIDNVFKTISVESDNTTLITLENQYVQDGKSLMVFLNGLLVFPGLDYEETSNTSITFNYDLTTGDMVAVKIQDIVYK